MVLESDPATKLTLGDGKLVLFTKIVGSVPECGAHEMNDYRGNTKGNLISKIPHVHVQPGRYICQSEENGHMTTNI